MQAVEDAVRTELRPMYCAAHQRIVEAMAPLALKLSALNSDLQHVSDLVGGSSNLPVLPWPELRFSAMPSHADFQSKLSRWLSYAKQAGYDV